MRERCEFRILEDYAHLLVGPDEGTRLGGIARKVVLSTSDPRFLKVGELQRVVHDRDGRSFFFGWSFSRYYSQKEMAAAKLFHLKITSVFDPAGAECGTEYDFTGACQECGAGRLQRSPLTLDTSKLPRGKDIAKTIGEEIVISKRLSAACAEAGLSGYTLGPIMDVKSHKQIADWFQLDITSNPIRTNPPTQYGIDPFDPDAKGAYRCRHGHVSGLALLSELHLDRDDWDCSDFSPTLQLIGRRSGLLVPHPLFIISPTALTVLSQIGAKGYKVEVAYIS